MLGSSFNRFLDIFSTNFKIKGYDAFGLMQWPKITIEFDFSNQND